MHIGDLVILSKSISQRSGIKYIFEYILQNNLIGIITDKRPLYYSKYEGQVYELTIRWSDGSMSDMSEKYLERLNGSP
jgi:hypothetical protein